MVFCFAKENKICLLIRGITLTDIGMNRECGVAAREFHKLSKTHKVTRSGILRIWKSVSSGLLPWEAPVVIAEKRKLFFSFFLEKCLQQNLHCVL